MNSEPIIVQFERSPDNRYKVAPLPITVEFLSLETLINTLEGLSVKVTGQEIDTQGKFLGWRPDLHKDGVYMFSLHDEESGELILATEIRNVTEITIL
jgi:hypothetical protein